MKLQFTNNLSQFKTMYGNREVQEDHVKKLLASFSENPHLWSLSPILVNTRSEVIDGQHRLEVAKRLGVGVYFIQVSVGGLQDVQIINSRSKRWSELDYAKSYADMGDENYKTYYEMRKKYGLSHSIIVQLLSRSGRGTMKNRNFKDGGFVVSDKNFAISFCENIMQLSEIYKGAKTRSFCNAFLSCLENEDFSREKFMKKLLRYPNRIEHVASEPEHLRQIETIYNFHTSEKNKIRLF